MTTKPTIWFGFVRTSYKSKPTFYNTHKGCGKKQVINMDETKWSGRSTEIRSWLATNEKQAGAMLTVIQSNLDAGDNATNDDDRDKIWMAVRAICGTLDVSPIKKGQRMDATLSASLDSIESTLTVIYTDLYNNNPLIQAIEQPSARTGGTYTLESYIEAKISSHLGKLKRAHNEERWDMTLDKKSNLPTLTPFPIKEDE